MTEILSRSVQDVMEKYGISKNDLEKSLRRKKNIEKQNAVTAIFEKHSSELMALVENLMDEAPIKPSISGTWVGSAAMWDVDGLNIKLVITDKVASDARKVELKARK